MAFTTKLKKLTTAQIKVGDVLIREHDHIGRPDDKKTIQGIEKLDKRVFLLDNYRQMSGAELSAENYRIVERNGKRIGSFFVKYWVDREG